MKKTDIKIKRDRKFQEKLRLLGYLQKIDPITQKVKHKRGVFNLLAVENELNRLDNKISQQKDN